MVRYTVNVQVTISDGMIDLRASLLNKNASRFQNESDLGRRLPRFGHDKAQAYPALSLQNRPESRFIEIQDNGAVNIDGGRDQLPPAPFPHLF